MKKTFSVNFFNCLVFNPLLFSATATDAQGIQGDLDKDGDVDIFDYNILIENFGLGR